MLSSTGIIKSYLPEKMWKVLCSLTQLNVKDMLMGLPSYRLNERL